MQYRFKVTPEIREAIYASLCHANERTLIQGDEVVRYLSDTRNKDPDITLSDTQVSAILHGIEKAIEAQSSDMGDWTRATEYMKARDYLIAETRKQFKLWKNGTWVTLVLAIAFTACTTSSVKIDEIDLQEADLNASINSDDDTEITPDLPSIDLATSLEPTLSPSKPTQVKTDGKTLVVVYYGDEKNMKAVSDSLHHVASTFSNTVHTQNEIAPTNEGNYKVRAGDTWYRLARWCLGMPYEKARSSRALKIQNISVSIKSSELQAQNPKSPVLLQEGTPIFLRCDKVETHRS